jgi:hypothetical protein
MADQATSDGRSSTWPMHRLMADQATSADPAPAMADQATSAGRSGTG